MDGARTPRRQDRWGHGLRGRTVARRFGVTAFVLLGAVATVLVPTANAAARTGAAPSRPSDPGFAQQWGLENRGQSVLGRHGTPGADVSALAAWSVTRGAGVTVGVVDSGIDPATGVTLAPGGSDLVDGDGIPTDRFGHGTAIASIVAAPIDGAGVVGLAPQSAVLAIRVLDATGAASRRWPTGSPAPGTSGCGSSTRR
jgi:hypothetical protein